MTTPLPDDVHQALQQGDKIEAIRRLRLATGLGLKEAMDAVEAAHGAPAGSTPVEAGPTVPSAAVQAALRQGNTIEAIRLLRDERGLGLKEARDQVMLWQKSVPSAPGELPRTPLRTALALGIIALMLVWLVLTLTA